MDEAMIGVVFARGKLAKWTGGEHAGVVLVRLPLMLKFVREKDFREK